MQKRESWDCNIEVGNEVKERERERGQEVRTHELGKWRSRFNETCRDRFRPPVAEEKIKERKERDPNLTFKQYSITARYEC